MSAAFISFQHSDKTGICIMKSVLFFHTQAGCHANICHHSSSVRGVTSGTFWSVIQQRNWIRLCRLRSCDRQTFWPTVFLIYATRIQVSDLFL